MVCRGSGDMQMAWCGDVFWKHKEHFIKSRSDNYNHQYIKRSPMAKLGARMGLRPPYFFIQNFLQFSKNLDRVYQCSPLSFNVTEPIAQLSLCLSSRLQVLCSNNNNSLYFYFFCFTKQNPFYSQIPYALDPTHFLFST